MRTRSFSREDKYETSVGNESENHSALLVKKLMIDRGHKYVNTLGSTPIG